MRAAQRKDAGLPVTREAAMAKLYASEVGGKICDEGVQIHGGYGFIKDYPAEKFYRDVKLCTIGEGTSEIQRMVIARELLRGLGRYIIIYGMKATEEKAIRGETEGQSTAWSRRCAPETCARCRGQYRWLKIMRRMPEHFCRRAFLIPGQNAGDWADRGAGRGQEHADESASAGLSGAGKSCRSDCGRSDEPYTGGAILGDRIRMQSHESDTSLYVRSMATRGFMGGLARTTADVATVMEASGKDVLLIETVGVGQDEIDIVRLADVTVVMLVPGMGDDVQSLKAGIMEIAKFS